MMKRFTLFIVFLFLVSVIQVKAASFDSGSKKGGHFEIGIHYGAWSINLIKSLIEEGIGDALATEIKDAILEDIQAVHPWATEQSYEQDVNVDSSGENYGLEVRWYPKGTGGSFSLGLSVEKSTMNVSVPDVTARYVATDGSVFDGNARADFEIKPLSFHLNFRWDIKPAWRIRPYITFGFGIASGTYIDEAEMNYSYSGILNIPGEASETVQETDSTTLGELKDELEAEGDEFVIPGVLPFFQLNIGVKGEITSNIYILLDVGIWDGFLLRGGVAIRF